MAAHVDDYLRLRRGLGFTLAYDGVLLLQFVEYLQAQGAISVTTELSIAWAQLPQGVAPISWSHRLGAVRGFARYMTTIDASTEVPPSGVRFPRKSRHPLFASALGARWKDVEHVKSKEVHDRVQG